jgi:hypothetical protein
MQQRGAPISYADLPARHGVSRQLNESSLRLVVPPGRLWRMHPWVLVGIASTLGTMGFIALESVGTSGAMVGSADFWTLWINEAFYFALLTVLVIYLWQCWRSWIVLDVTPSELVVSRRTSRATRQRRWPRTQIGEVRRNRSSNKLFVRIVGQEFVEIPISPDKDVVEYVAEEINSALWSLPLSAQALSSRIADSPPAAMPQGRSRNALLIAAIGIAACAVGMLFMGMPWSVLSIYIFAAAGIPAGIAMGTQGKKFWV